MAAELNYENAEDIGILLSDAHPQINPMEIEFSDLRKYVTDLPEFKDDPKNLDEVRLKAIQAAWHEEYQDRTQD